LVIKQKRSSHDALSSGFQLVQVYDLLGWNDGIGDGTELIEMTKLIRDARNSESISFSTKTFTTKYSRQNIVTPSK